jgi:hypothetical protein
MPTLRELFSGEFNLLKSDVEMTVSSDASGQQGTVISRVYYDFDANARFMSYFVPEESAHISLLGVLLTQHEEVLRQGASSVLIRYSHPILEPVATNGGDLPFTGRVIMYVDALVGDEAKAALRSIATQLGVTLQLRDKTYSAFITETETPLAFLSHDSRDKDDLVRPLADKLRSMLCPVWYDEYSLEPGDSLRESIDKGLRISKRCVIVLSGNFMGNSGWTKAEFNAALNRHISSGGKVVIPIWHGVGRAEVAEYSPIVVDLVALNSTTGIEQLATRLYQLLMPSPLMDHPG